MERIHEQASMPLQLHHSQVIPNNHKEDKPNEKEGKTWKPTHIASWILGAASSSSGSTK